MTSAGLADLVMKKSRTEHALKVELEKSKSKSGKHAFVRLAVKVDLNSGEVKEVIQPTGGSPPKTYSKGVSKTVNVKYGEDEALVVISLVKVPHKSPKRRVKGTAEVYVGDQAVYKVKYVKGLLRGSKGDPKYFPLVKAAFEKLDIPFKRANPDAHLPSRRDRRRDEAN